MDRHEASWIEESHQAMHGWDFSHLKGRCETEALPWDYRGLVQQYLKPNDEWLDMDTGGGELMSSFKHPAEKTSVTEGWQPNIDLLNRTQVAQGITLYADPEGKMAEVPSDHFEVVTNSHGGLPIAAISRVLRPDGVFISQQVGATNNYSLSRFLNGKYAPAFPDNNLLQVITQLQSSGFRILKADASFVKMRFTDVGAIVYYATVIPWEFTNFDVNRAMPELHQLQDIIANVGDITTFEDRFIVVATKDED
ncbi:SAM-dependent methyltransferase [Lacticaseibacillus chiayiensis]|uniref:SAM-dependent methyltransferase n=1 Tax=Lacticaseibacillus chiayiensis TaxID=2100821 RepID=UPI00101313F1|nr:SAM-dependent methyltransferase [Lacticaseibacillus chiayiensis]RXT57817.1 SAM-dependent methyltransferase [Lacticaseibacillus chiayiensis]